MVLLDFCVPNCYSHPTRSGKVAVSVMYTNHVGVYCYTYGLTCVRKRYISIVQELFFVHLSYILFPTCF